MERIRLISSGRCAVAALLLVAGCVAGPVGAVMTGLSLFGAATGGGPQRLEIDPNRAMSESLSKAMASIDPRCEAALERERRKLMASEIRLAPNECRRTPVCLPGAGRPTMMLVCAPARTGADAAARTGADAAAPTRTEAAAPTRGEWTWATED